MWYYLVKVAISAVIIVAVSEVAKRSSGFAALVASLPLTSLLAIIWLRAEGAQITQIAELSQQIFWLVLPSLILFLLLPVLLRYGLAFWLSLSLASAATILCYFLMIPLLRRFGVSI
jgi:hypothetical protein